MDNMRSRAGGLKAYENRQAQDGREEAYIIKGLRINQRVTRTYPGLGDEESLGAGPRDAAALTERFELTHGEGREGRGGGRHLDEPAGVMQSETSLIASWILRCTFLYLVDRMTSRVNSGASLLMSTRKQCCPVSKSTLLM
ncbi:hypothetical protein ABBQ32_002746 [Trebouxia sp. C0010 RCD-2024]